MEGGWSISKQLGGYGTLIVEWALYDGWVVRQAKYIRTSMGHIKIADSLKVCSASERTAENLEKDLKPRRRLPRAKRTTLLSSGPGRLPKEEMETSRLARSPLNVEVCMCSCVALLRCVSQALKSFPLEALAHWRLGIFVLQCLCFFVRASLELTRLEFFLKKKQKKTKDREQSAQLDQVIQLTVCWGFSVTGRRSSREAVAKRQ